MRSRLNKTTSAITGAEKADQRKASVFTVNSWRFLPVAMALSAAIVLASAWVFTLNQQTEMRRSLIDQFKREQANLITILAENLNQVFSQHLTLVSNVRHAVDVAQEDAYSSLPMLFSGGTAFNRVALYLSSGQLLYRSSPEKSYQIPEALVKKLLQRLSVQRVPFTFHTELIRTDAPWQVPFIFSLDTTAHGRIAMVLEVDLGYLLRLYRDIDLGRTGYLLVQTRDGQILARAESGGLVAHQFHQRGAYPAETEGQPHLLISTSLNLDQTVYSTYYHLSPYPITVSINQDLEEVLAPFESWAMHQLRLLALLSFLCGAGGVWFVRIAHQKSQFLAALLQADQRNTELIDQLELEHQQAIDAASFDSLTGLYNRRMFIELAQKNLLFAQRNSLLYALMFIDLDRFKTINDSLGHVVGDQLLKAVAVRLQGCVRQTDIVARLGGDEFVILLNEMSPQTDIVNLAQKIVSTLSQPYENLEDNTVHTSPSMGIAVYPGDGADIHRLMKSADSAMYRSKKAGRGLFTFFDPSQNTHSDRAFEFEQQLPKAIQQGQLVLHYQPKLRVDTMQLAGIEALVRWQHPQYDLVYPNDFVPLAEKCGLISDLGYWVLKQACRQLHLWRGAGVQTVPVAVNVAPQQFREKGFAQKVLDLIRECQLQPSDIEIEVTESSLSDEEDSALFELQLLEKAGIRIALDDFGNGFSNLSRIRTLPISTLKIDRSFIRNLRKQSGDEVIVSSTIELAQKLGLTVVAEGVETSEQLMQLKVSRCDQVQGYLFSRPLPDNEMEKYMRHHHAECAS